MIDYAAIYAALYGRAASGSAGATLRALLGTFPAPFPLDSAFAGQRAVFPADRLGAFAASGVTLPWLVWRAGAAAGASGQMRDLGASWWAYAAPNAGSYPLHQIAAMLETLYGYTNALVIAGGRTRVTFIGRPFPDAALGLNGMEIRVGFTQLG